MKKISILWMSLLLLMVAGCSNDDEGSGYITPNSLLGKWETAHRSNNPDVFDTADLWEFIFLADGTGVSDISTGANGVRLRQSRCRAAASSLVMWMTTEM